MKKIKLIEMVEGKTEIAVYNTVEEVKNSLEVQGYLDFLVDVINDTPLDRRDEVAEKHEEMVKDIENYTNDDIEDIVWYINKNFDYSWYALKAEIV